MVHMYVNGFEGIQLNSKCVLVSHNNLYGMILESWGQQNNPKYNEALKVIISRMQLKGIKKIDAFLASKPVIKSVPDSEARRLSNHTDGLFYIENKDPESLRLELCRQQKYFSESGRKEVAKGNGSKRIFLHASELTSESDWKEIVLGSWNDNFESTSDVVELSKRVGALLNGEIHKPYGALKPNKISIQSKVYARSPAVVAYILQESKGSCEACFQSAPFISDAGKPFLEVHHIVPLSDGGPDIPENCVALCPNCHRAMHYALNRKELMSSLYHNIARLKIKV